MRRRPSRRGLPLSPGPARRTCSATSDPPRSGSALRTLCSPDPPLHSCRRSSTSSPRRRRPASAPCARAVAPTGPSKRAEQARRAAAAQSPPLTGSRAAAAPPRSGCAAAAQRLRSGCAAAARAAQTQQQHSSSTTALARKPSTTPLFSHCCTWWRRRRAAAAAAAARRGGGGGAGWLIEIDGPSGACSSGPPAAQVAVRTGGAHSVEVWFAVLAALSELGLDSEGALRADARGGGWSASSTCSTRAASLWGISSSARSRGLPRLTTILDSESFNDIQNAIKHQRYYLYGSATLLGTRLFKTCSVFKTPAAAGPLTWTPSRA